MKYLILRSLFNSTLKLFNFNMLSSQTISNLQDPWHPSVTCGAKRLIGLEITWRLKLVLLDCTPSMTYTYDTYASCDLLRVKVMTVYFVQICTGILWIVWDSMVCEGIMVSARDKMSPQEVVTIIFTAPLMWNCRSTN